MSSWIVDCYSVYFTHKCQDLNNYKNNYKKDEIEQESLLTCLNNAVTGFPISANPILEQYHYILWHW